MLKVYDFDKNFISVIDNYKDLKIESELKSADKTLSFTYLGDLKLQEEYYLETQEDEYVIKEINTEGFPKVTALLNVEELESRIWETFAATDSTLKEAVNMALTDTGWRVGTCEIEKRRSVALTNTDSLQVIGKLCAAWMCECIYDTKAKTVSFFEKIGKDRGIYFIRDLNLKKSTVNTDTYDYYTQIEPVGADGLKITEVNQGKAYLENYQYTKKKKRYLWIDESYTDPEVLKEDAALKLEDLSKPKKSYNAQIRDLAKQRPEYEILAYHLGDRVLLIDPETGVKDKQRIVKLTVWPDDADKNSCELSNTVLTFEELQQQYKDAADVVANITTNDGTVKGSAVDKIVIRQIVDFEANVAVIAQGYFSELKADYVYVAGELGAVKAAIGEITTTYLKATDADIKYAQIENLKTEYARIDLANIARGAIKTAMIGDGVVGSAQIADGSITNAKIVELSANKITAGVLSVERLIIRGNEKSIVYALNNIDGALQAQNVDTLNGEVLTDRTITGDKVVAKSITAGEIASKTITANEILAGAITAAELAAECITADKIAAGDIVGTNGMIDLKAGTFDYGRGKMRWDGRNLNIEADNMSIGGKPVASEEQVDHAKSLLVSLSNDYVTVPTDYKGDYTVLPDCKTTAVVYWGSEDITNSVFFSVSESPGLTGTWDAGTKTYEVTGLEEDSGWVEIRATYLNTLRASAKMTIVKQKDVSTVGDKVQEIESKKMYRVETRVEGKSIFTDKGETSLMRCYVYSWDDDITDTLNPSLFSWHRNSGDETADEEWDAYHTGMKQIHINTEDVMNNASFFCAVNLE
ncbi:phage tail protein [Ruminococcus sp. OA3]|uniref:phage tail protein n=1 Tax=Ruminococcus sp. OA3 TaxID=2914164 RepID=UPI001F061029|nr:phage tail protein [Ruminococcus sp. OA3]MCH1984546.1 phage tail protein [Ruminococcus sp. OA3]